MAAGIAHSFARMAPAVLATSVFSPTPCRKCALDLQKLPPLKAGRAASGMVRQVFDVHDLNK